jgi:hypothetical protein
MICNEYFRELNGSVWRIFFFCTISSPIFDKCNFIGCHRRFVKACYPIFSLPGHTFLNFEDGGCSFRRNVCVNPQTYLLSKHGSVYFEE